MARPLGVRIVRVYTLRPGVLDPPGYGGLPATAQDTVSASPPAQTTTPPAPPTPTGLTWTKCSPWTGPAGEAGTCMFSTYAITDSAGAVAERYACQPCGQLTTYDAAYATPQPTSRLGNPFTFTGRELDAESTLMHYRARAYAPTHGRFLQPDPLEYVDGMGLYAYVAGRPTAAIDPSGENIYGIDGAVSEGLGYGEQSAVRRVLMHANEPAWYSRGSDIAGIDTPYLALEMYKKICSDYCADKSITISIIGYSRGAIVALMVANRIALHGYLCNCRCVGYSYRTNLITGYEVPNTRVYRWECERYWPTITMVGLFDPVKMQPHLHEMWPLDAVTNVFV